MEGRILLILILISLLVPTPPARTPPPARVEEGASPSRPIGPRPALDLGPRAAVFTNNSVYKGDLVVNGSGRLIIRDVNFTITGNIIARDEAVVIIENAVVNMNVSRTGEYSITMWDRTNLTIREATVRSLNPDYQFYLFLYNETKALFFKAKFEHSLEWYGSSEVRVLESKVRWVRCCGAVRTNLTYSEVQVLLSAEGISRVWLYRCWVWTLRAFRRAWVEAVDCQVGYSVVCYNDATMRLINVTAEKIYVSTILADKAKIYIMWYLDVTVLLEGSPVEGAEVLAFFPNGSLAASGTTDASGHLRLILIERILRKNDVLELANYTLRALHGQLASRDLGITLVGNKEVVLDILATLVLKCSDGDGEPVEGLRLELSRKEYPKGLIRVHTNRTGFGVFFALSTGSYELRAYYLGVEVLSMAGINISKVDVYRLDLNCPIYDLHVLVKGMSCGPLEGVYVHLYLINGTHMGTVLTNASGIASFSNLPATSYKVVVEADGFRRVEKVVKLTEEDQVEEFSLEIAKEGLPLWFLPTMFAGALSLVLIPTAYVVWKAFRISRELGGSSP